MNLKSLEPEEIYGKLDLSLPGLAGVKKSAGAGDAAAAADGLLEYYRLKYPPPGVRGENADLEEADRICRRVFKYKCYGEAAYEGEMNWEWNPHGDREWVAGLYRFLWARSLADAYTAVKDDKYAAAFVELAGDWISKHRLENHSKPHPDYEDWEGFAWLDIQTGIRAANICYAFRAMAGSPEFTGGFLEKLLASVYDHQVKTLKMPMGRPHNKAIFEQKGFMDVCVTFSEFRESREWMKIAASRSRENFLAQTTADGVQREWAFWYHVSVMKDMADIIRSMEFFKMSPAEDVMERLNLAHDYIFRMAAPRLEAPMFGDAARAHPRGRDSLVRVMLAAAGMFDAPEYAVLAGGDAGELPARGSRVFPEAGMYVFRGGRGPGQIYMPLHCSPPSISGHDQPDNGTFELYAFGRWLMPDTGFYTYGGDAEKRAWHMRTAVHQTMTLDGMNAAVDGRHLLWARGDDFEALCAENSSYPGLVHRRTVWFVDREFFLLLDEAIGSSAGALDLHFQLAPGEEALLRERSAYTVFEDANVLVRAADNCPADVSPEEGWHSREYGHRERRPAFRFRHASSAPAAFLTVVVPFRGKQVPGFSCVLPGGFVPGAPRAEVTARAPGAVWKAGRDLETGGAWCEKAG